MDTLRLSMLAVLIPVGLLLSKTAPADPEPLGQTHIRDEQRTDRRCFLQDMQRPESGKRSPESFIHSGSAAIHFAPPNTTTLHPRRGQPADACWLDLDAIETD